MSYKRGNMKRPRISKYPNKNWKNNAIQFPRLIAELEAIGVFTHKTLRDLERETDLTEKEIYDLIDRAQEEWNKIKAQFVCSACRLGTTNERKPSERTNQNPSRSPGRAAVA